MDIGPGEEVSISVNLGEGKSSPVAKWTEFRLLACCETCGKQIEQNLLDDSAWDQTMIVTGKNCYAQVNYCPECMKWSLRYDLRHHGVLWPRWIHRWFAKANGYFWLPCPVCGKMFGGHERHGSTEYVNGSAKLTCGCNGFESRMPSASEVPFWH